MAAVFEDGILRSCNPEILSFWLLLTHSPVSVDDAISVISHLDLGWDALCIQMSGTI